MISKELIGKLFKKLKDDGAKLTPEEYKSFLIVIILLNIIITPPLIYQFIKLIIWLTRL